jgi:hypothetical protein
MDRQKNKNTEIHKDRKIQKTFTQTTFVKSRKIFLWRKLREYCSLKHTDKVTERQQQTNKQTDRQTDRQKPVKRCEISFMKKTLSVHSDLKGTDKHTKKT